jgi:hypothetical protein
MCEEMLPEDMDVDEATKAWIAPLAEFVMRAEKRRKEIYREMEGLPAIRPPAVRLLHQVRKRLLRVDLPLDEKLRIFDSFLEESKVCSLSFLRHRLKIPSIYSPKKVAPIRLVNHPLVTTRKPTNCF